MLNKHIIGELFEIAQNYKNGRFEFKQIGGKQCNLFAENNELMILKGSRKYSIVIRTETNDYIHLYSLSSNITLELLYFLKETYNNCKEYPNAFSNALKQMCYKYKKDKERI